MAGIKFIPNKRLDGGNLKPLILNPNSYWPPRRLFSFKRDQVSVRNDRFRLDAKGQLFDITKDPGQRNNIAAKHPDLVVQLSELAKAHSVVMQKHFKSSVRRRFTVGYGKSTTLTARDGIPHGTIQRSSKAPNNSFFTNWTKKSDYITWNVEIAKTGTYEAILYYTCAKGDEGVALQLHAPKSGHIHFSIVKEAFDPPLYDKSKERVEKSHYFVKDFKPHHLGMIKFKRSRGELKLETVHIPGNRAVDVHSIELILQ